MNRQYIGARYVPKFFNNNGSNEWVSGISYEALTVVTYLNCSYTSVKNVPSNIGAPNVATDYWVCTSNIPEIISDISERLSVDENAISSLNDSVDDIKEDYAKRYTINNRKFIIGSDSYGTSSFGNWVAQLAEYLGVSSDYINCAVDGSSFGNPQYPNLRWLTILQNTTSTLTTAEKEAITDIVYLGGINDALPNAEYEDVVQDVTDDFEILLYIKGKILEFADYCKVNFPNAIISLGFIGNTVEGIDRRNYEYVARAMFAWTTACGERNNLRFIDNLQYIMHNYSYMSADHIHPTEAGGKEIAKRCASALLGGNASFDIAFPNRYVEVNDVASSSGLESHITRITIGYDNKPKGARISNELLEIRFGQDYSVEFNNNESTITVNNCDEICIGDLTNKEVVFGKGLVYIPCKARYYNRSISPFTYGEFTATYLRIYQGKIYLNIKTVDANYEVTSKAITQIIIVLPNITMNTLLN